MIGLLIDRVALALLLGLTVMAALAVAEPTPPEIVIQKAIPADFPVCSTVHHAPLLEPPSPQWMRPPHVHSDGGMV